MIAGALYVLGAFMASCFAVITLGANRGDGTFAATVATFAVLWPFLTLYVVFGIVWDRCATR